MSNIYNVNMLKAWQNPYCDNTQIDTKQKLWQCKNGENTETVTKLQMRINFYFYKSQIVAQTNCDKTYNVTILKLWQNSKCYNT